MSAQKSPCILLFLKAPRPGFVKTRLAKDLGPIEACHIYQKLVKHTLSQIPDDWELRINFAPGDAIDEMKSWLGSDNKNFLPQPEGDLGSRLTHACQQAFAEESNRPVILLGGDCPGLRKSHLLEAATQLSAGQPVIGPAADGGYWLLGLPSEAPSLFEDIPWSTEQVLSLTLLKFQDLGTAVHQLDTLEDVDELATWERNRTQILASEESENSGE